MSLTHAEARQIAARYVEAFFDLALKAKKEAKVADNLAALKAVMAESEELRKAVKNPMISVGEKKAVFAEILGRIGAEKTTGEFVDFLAEKQRLEVLSALADLFAAKLAAHKGELTAEITSAKKLKAAQKKEIEKVLKEAAGQPVSITTKEDPSIMGGVVIRMGSTLLDHSVAGKLNRLAVALKQPTMA